ncbi:hypothetical protein MTR67_012216 [Solanum verrucosum]|uniref:Reverse transcriptase/retrotransposon-derived protein RNase H-like domain-containing protein n=1 Tax=Solanum verrucosum TaxID=315347 RepID=A0AAF0TGT1_SOLVR|nr:hypothetical protein MTR67_012216 [Solanum verrucosum]
MKGFLSNATPLTELSHLHVPFELLCTCDLCFCMLKKFLTIAIILNLLVEVVDFAVYRDASSLSFGYVFMQHGHVITYVSRKIKAYECNYSTHDFDLELVIFPLMIWKH